MYRSAHVYDLIYAALGKDDAAESAELNPGGILLLDWWVRPTKDLSSRA